MEAITCLGKQQWPELVGEKAQVVKRQVEKENPRVKAIVVKPGHLVTHDYRCDRVWLWTNDAGNVIKVPHVG